MTDLDDIVQRVADGGDVDWDAAERAAASGDERQLVRSLRAVHRLAWRGGPSEPDSPTAAAGAWGRLELRERLGVGSFGEVYRAWNPVLRREVALKLYRRDVSAATATRALQEGRALARVDHPNVVRVHGAEVHDGRVGLWMDLVPGRSLRELLETQGPLAPHEAATIGIELCRALAAIHLAGLVHCDVKAANVMRREGGRIVLMDLGEVRRAEGIEPGPVSGTPLYMAPELFAGAPSTPRSDIYALGVLLYHLVTGAYPVGVATPGEVSERLSHGEVRLLRDERPDLPAAFVRAVERALALDPADRFATAGEMERALGVALGVEPSGEAKGSASGIPRWLPWLGMALAVALVAVFVLAVRPRDSTAPTEGPARSTVATEGTTSTYTASARMFRVLPGGQRERLESGDHLSVGDHVGLEFEASRSVHVYVINEDATGGAFVLFPLPYLEPRNPLPAGRVSLPGISDGEPQYWVASSAGGRERLLLLASPEPLADFEAEMAKLPRPAAGEAAIPLPSAARERLRSLGRLGTSPPGTVPPRPAATRLFEMAKELSAELEVVDGVWIRQFAFENPGTATER